MDKTSENQAVTEIVVSDFVMKDKHFRELAYDNCQLDSKPYENCRHKQQCLNEGIVRKLWFLLVRNN